MNTLVEITLVNAACAAILALGVTLASRFVKRPAVIHTLWIVVLLQLLMPPVLEVGLLPRPAPTVSERPLAQTLRLPDPGTVQVHSGDSAGTVAPAFAARLRPGDLATTIWIAGTLWLLGLAVVRTARFRRLVRATASRDLVLERRLSRIAERMDIRRPALRLVRASISPLIRPRIGGAELIFPMELLSRLDVGEQEAILAHELAHVARRDHWVRILELIAVSLCWWHPAVWWARSRLRLAEERCCDQLVLRSLPGGRSSYARGLLKTVEFLAGTNTGLPALASGVGEVRDLKERLTMILKERPPKSMSKTQRTLLVLCAASVLLIFPTWSDRDLQAAPSDETTNEDAREDALAAAEREYQNQRLELEERVIELEYALREVRERQAELEQVWRNEMRSAETLELEYDVIRDRAEGAHERAREMYEQARELSRQAEPEARERDHSNRQASVEYSLQRTLLELERATQEGDHDRVAELRLEIARVKRHLRESRIGYELERSRAAQERVEADLERLRADGHDEAADRLESEIEALREQRLEERMLREIEIQRRLENLDNSGQDEIIR